MNNMNNMNNMNMAYIILSPPPPRCPTTTPDELTLFPIRLNKNRNI